MGNGHCILCCCSEGDEAEYESDGVEADDSVEEEEDSRASREESSVNEHYDSGQNSRMQDSNRNTFLQLQQVTEKLSKMNDNLSSYNPSKINEEDTFDKPKSKNEYQSSSEHRDTSRYMSKNFVDQPEPRQFSSRDESYKSLRDEKVPIDKQAQAVSNEEGEVLFEHSDNQQGRQERTSKNEYDRPRSASSYRSSKQFCNSMQEGVPEKYTKATLDRDRRAAQDTKATSQKISTVGNEPINVAVAANAAAANVAASNAVTSAPADAISNVAEDEEAAIKRHVKKLSAEELEELLNSLSEDKRRLLKKIMDTDTEANNDINKREITKKAGAAPDDNSYLEGGQSDASKLVSDTNSQNSATESTDISNKQQNSQSSDIVLPVTTKSSDDSNDTTFASLFSEKKVDNPSTIDTNNQAAVKSNSLSIKQPKANKREISTDQLSSIQNSYDSSSFDEDDDKLADLSGFGYYCPQEKDSDFDNDQSEFFNKDGNTLKREISEKESEDSDAMKSLAESFPNSNSYDDNDLESDSAPLVRVKRKNLDFSVKKRSANIMPDAKVAYFPYRAENDDEDNDEGNEFDDEGFYNPTVNLAKNDIKGTIPEDKTPNGSQDSSLNQSPNTQLGLNLDTSKTNNNLEGETANLGSDTDSVLSSGEGIDENLMFNSASRNKRSSDVEDFNVDEELTEIPNKELTRLSRSTALEDEINSVTEKEPFNPPSGNYEGDSVRYKRIRGVK